MPTWFLGIAPIAGLKLPTQDATVIAEGRGGGVGAKLSDSKKRCSSFYIFSLMICVSRIAGDPCLRTGHVDPAEGGAEDSLRLFPPHGRNIPPLHHPRPTR